MTVRSNFRQPPSRLAIVDCVTLAPPLPGGGRAPWPVHRPVLGSVLCADRVRYSQWKFSFHSISFADEAEGIRKIDQLIAGRTATTFEGRSFGWQILAMAAMRARVFDATHITAAWTSHRFSGAAIDVADLMSAHGAADPASLSMLCWQLGIPCQRNPSRRGIASILRHGGTRALYDRSEQKCSAILMLFASVQALRSCDVAFGATLISDFANWVIDAGCAHLAAFGQLSGQELLERARLKHMLDEGLWSLDHRLRLKRAGAIDGESIFNPGFEDYDG